MTTNATMAVALSPAGRDLVCNQKQIRSPVADRPTPTAPAFVLVGLGVV
jgi:hypothetical protein